MYPVGINGLTLTLGINLLFHQKHLPYTAEWCFTGKKLLNRVSELLDADIPVILGVGPQIPQIWKRDGLPFYRMTPGGACVPVTSVCAHYVTVTAMDERFLTISSWGRKYYIRQDELRDYIRKHSTYLFSNILYIRKREN